MTGTVRGFHERMAISKVFGTTVRAVVEEPADSGLPSAAAVALQIQGLMRTIHRNLTRFDPASALSRFNADRHTVRPASPLLRRAARAGLAGAELSAGICDPTLIREIGETGYRRSRVGVEPASLEAALSAVDLRAPAGPSERGAWREIEVDDERCVIVIPSDTGLDLGGSTKGMAADLAAERLSEYPGFAVDCGGDIRIGGTDPVPRRVDVTNPLRPELAWTTSIRRGAIATSGLATRIWMTGSGYAHHLLDPATGSPAWTGLVQASALAPDTVRAEALAKAALLAGPDGAGAILAAHGGCAIADDGNVTVIPPPREE